MKNNNPTAIISPDWHLRIDQPICRTDDFWEAQWKAIKFIFDTQRKFNYIPILHPGDLFHKWKPEYLILNTLFEKGLTNLIIVPGNHDLKNHNIVLISHSGISILEMFDESINLLLGNAPCRYYHTDSTNFIIHGYPWMMNPSFYDNYPNLTDAGVDHYQVKHIALIHILTYKKKSLWPGMEAMEGSDLLNKMQGYDLIVSGHNHKGFVIKKDGRLLVNPGCLTRQTADQSDYKPRVYLWYAETNEVEKVYLPIEKDVISREHIELKQERDERLDKFVSTLITEEDIDISFEKNINLLLSKPHIRKPIKEMVKESMECQIT